MTDKHDLPYRPCAGVMLLNRDGLAFAGQRIDTTMEAWQMPQGGIDPGEDAGDAALRELGEDTDIDLATPHPEFMSWRWVDPHALPSLIVPFKRQLYKDVIAAFSGHLPPA